MLTTIIAVVIATVVALATGGRLANLPTERPRWWPLVPVAVVLLLTPQVLPAEGGAGTGLVVAALAGLIAFAAANLRLVGMAVVLAGLALNAAVIVANGAMPVDPAAAVAAGVVRGEDLTSLELGPARRWRSPEDRIAGLGDILPMSPLDEVVSFGDLIIAAGLANVTFRLFRPLGRRPLPRPRRRRAPRHRRPLLSMPFPAR